MKLTVSCSLTFSFLLAFGFSLAQGQPSTDLLSLSPCQVYADARGALTLREAIQATQGEPCQQELQDRIAELARREASFLQESGAYRNMFLQAKSAYEGTSGEAILAQAAENAITREEQANELAKRVKQGKPLSTATLANTPSGKTDQGIAAGAEATPESAKAAPDEEVTEEEAADKDTAPGGQEPQNEETTATPTTATEESQETEQATDKASEEEEKRLMALAEDEATWMTASKINTLEEYKGYLKAYPNGRHAEEAKAKIDEMEESESQSRSEEEKILELAKEKAKWMQAEKSGKKSDYEGYLKEYPEGLHAKKAKEQIEKLEELENAQKALKESQDKLAWKIAKLADTLEGYKKYLKEHPEGLYSEKAREKIAKMEK